jgi:hypothetical protein
MQWNLEQGECLHVQYPGTINYCHVTLMQSLSNGNKTFSAGCGTKFLITLNVNVAI